MYRTKDQVTLEIIAEGRRQGITPRGIVIGIATGLVESGLVVYANAKVPGSIALPHDAVGSDGMSVGVHQQQVRRGDTGQWWWGPVEVCQDPTGSSRLFFERLARRDYNNGDAGAHAQAIQQSAFPDRYSERMGEAQAIYNRLSSGAPAPAPVAGVSRANVEFAKRILADRVGNGYVYGGNWRPDNVKVGTDCSGLVVDICDAVRNGTAMAWSRHGMSTESWRPIDVGQTGTIFNTICVASPNDFPPDAAVKIAIHHGPGGGANSHTWCEVDGVRGESNGSDGCVTGARARSVYDTAYANDWHYLPGPIGAAAPTVDPFEELLMLEVESWSIYADPGEPKIPAVQMLQALDAHGPHEPYVEGRARAGDQDALRRVVRTAAGKGKYGTAPGPVNQAIAVLADIEKTNPAALQAFKSQNGASA